MSSTPAKAKAAAATPAKAKAASSPAPAAAAAAAPAAASASKSKSGVFISPMSVAALVVLLGVLLQLSPLPSLTGPAHSRKPFSSFLSFYPFYASEHADRTNRQCHFAGTCLVLLLFLRSPRAIPSLLLALLSGLALCPLTQGLGHGLLEGVAVMAIFLAAHKLSTGKFGVSVLIPLIGYGAAWYGHFFHEHNRPATFIYPTYSLLGDFYMWSRIATGVESF